jgi:hypothetical protein
METEIYVGNPPKTFEEYRKSSLNSIPLNIVLAVYRSGFDDLRDCGDKFNPKLEISRYDGGSPRRPTTFNFKTNFNFTVVPHSLIGSGNEFSECISERDLRIPILGEIDRAGFSHLTHFYSPENDNEVDRWYRLFQDSGRIEVRDEDRIKKGEATPLIICGTGSDIMLTKKLSEEARRGIASELWENVSRQRHYREANEPILSKILENQAASKTYAAERGFERDRN